MAAISHQKGTSFKFISKWNLFWHHVNRPLQQMPDSDCIFFELSELTVWSSRWKLRIPNHVKFSTATGVPFTPNITNTWYVIHHHNMAQSLVPRKCAVRKCWLWVRDWDWTRYNNTSLYGICACVFLERLYFFLLCSLITIWRLFCWIKLNIQDIMFDTNLQVSL